MDTRFEHNLTPNCVLILQPRKIFHLALSKEDVCVCVCVVYSKHTNWVIQLRTSPWNGKGITSLHETKDPTANTVRVMPNDSSSWCSIIEEYIHLCTYSKIKKHTHEIWPLPGMLSMARGHFCEAAQTSEPALCVLSEISSSGKCPCFGPVSCYSFSAECFGSALRAVLIGPWCSSCLTNQSLNLHNRVLICAVKSARFQSWEGEEVCPL